MRCSACIANPPLTTTLISVSSLQDAASELGIRKMQYDEAKHSYEAIEKVCVRAAVWHTSRADTLTTQSQSQSQSRSTITLVRGTAGEAER